VDAVVLDTDLPYVLLGNSFLSRFQLQWQGSQLQLGRAP
jgi:aspartyl protease family protein